MVHGLTHPSRLHLVGVLVTTNASWLICRWLVSPTHGTGERSIYPRRIRLMAEPKPWVGPVTQSAPGEMHAARKLSLPTPSLLLMPWVAAILPFSVTVRGMCGNFLQDTSGVCLSQLVVVVHGTVRRPAGYRWSSSPWPHCRARWPAVVVVGANDHIFLHLISAKRLRSDDHTGAVRKQKGDCHLTSECTLDWFVSWQSLQWRSGRSWSWLFGCCNLVWNNLLLKWVWKIKLEKLYEGTTVFEDITVAANN